MLSSLRFKLSSNGKCLGYQSSSLFQGVLMESISDYTAEDLHNYIYNPYSQFIERDDYSYWCIRGINEYAEENILKPLIGMKTIFLKNKNMDLKVLDMKYETINRNEFIEKYLFGEANNKIDFSFITPTAFRSEGRYIVVPSTRLIFQSLMKKFDESGKEKIFSYDLLEDMEKHSFISRYKLRTVLYCIEKVKIPAFIGDIQIRIDGPKEMQNIAKLLIKFGAYSGIGIKTAMGMGAIRMRGEDIG
ncbi:MAG: CRISPR-associated endoribonuclease Cas6 [Tissierellia bacterium]|nr:CRISPR-associated endoribonuclease Cas6 [Tissierellia bacterium]